MEAHIVGVSCFEFLDEKAVAKVVKEAQDFLGTIDTVLIAHGELPEQAATEDDFYRYLRVFSNRDCLFSEEHAQKFWDEYFWITEKVGSNSLSLGFDTCWNCETELQCYFRR